MDILGDILEMLSSVIEIFSEIGFKRLSKPVRILIICMVILVCLGVVGWIVWNVA